MSRKNKTISIGNCGEYFVAAELERRGFSAAIPMSNTKDFDILAISRESHKQYAIQVKTTSFGDLKWILSPKCEKLKGEYIYYVLVHLHELATPEYFIIPSTVLSNTVEEEFAKWLATPGRNGNQHNDKNVRTFVITNEFDKYRNAWDLLEK